MDGVMSVASIDRVMSVASIDCVIAVDTIDRVIASPTINGVVATSTREAVIATIVISIDGIGIVISTSIACPGFEFCFDPLIIDEDQSTVLLV